MDPLSDKETEMMPDRCTFCKGTLKMGKPEFMVRINHEVVVIKDIPAYICDRCNEAYFAPESSRKIDLILDSVRNGPVCGRPLAAIEVCMEE